ncbi:carbon-nitrogen hydrolase family protein [Sinimarinibacterium sp. CAU 1509]|uniref:carbon-nitrogen hydrolase family protein n=1 Tax=Sinimarinibacterium sp. CAU 1509 TaxID=2562283 RepID=UPI00146E80B4|nr:carbon-nitrogen hydrolase family protein [Sinimarinibacterium sp. CAU 1509]
MTIKLAVSQYPVSEPRTWNEVEAQLRHWCQMATDDGAQLLVYPEYAAMSLAALFDADTRADLGRQVQALQGLRHDYLALHRRLATELGVYIVAGSLPWTLSESCTVNRAWLCAPDGGVGFQDKQIVTRFERESWDISASADSGLKVFRTALGMIAINLCYDSEFPLLARAQCEAGAELLVVPSCTDTQAGYHRVRVGCQARALENQCYVAQSPLVGLAPWSPAIDINTGRAAVFGPPDYGFPDNGVVVEGRRDEPGWIHADIDLDAVMRVRNDGQVFNHRHWHEQGSISLPPVEQIDL